MKSFLIVVLLSISFPIYAQQLEFKDQQLLQKVSELYNAIPKNLSIDEVLNKLDELDKQFFFFLDSIQDKNLKSKAELLRYSGLFWGVRGYLFQQKGEILKEALIKRTKGLNLDAPDLNLLSGVEIDNLLNGYFQIFMPEYSKLERSTYVLYNVKSEYVHKLYVLPILVSELKKQGYTREIEEVMEDIVLCSKSEEILKMARELKNQYIPLKKGENAPDFDMLDEYGKQVKLSDFKGKIVFIDVWATWCKGCIEGLPYFLDLKEQYKDIKDIVFLTISIDPEDAKEYWLNFLKKRDWSGKIPHLIINGEKNSFEKEYCITGIPRYILIDQAGKIVNAWHISVKHELFPLLFSVELKQMGVKN